MMLFYQRTETSEEELSMTLSDCQLHPDIPLGRATDTTNQEVPRKSKLCELPPLAAPKRPQHLKMR